MSLEEQLLHKQREFLSKQTAARSHLKPLTTFTEVAPSQDETLKVACLLLAGGQGSRLDAKGPKGLFPISLVKQKSLFQLFFEKVAAASKKAGRPLSIAVMTSPLNRAETESFLKKHHWFGLSETQVFLFSQEMLPLLNEEGDWFRTTAGEIAQGPNGNGGALKGLYLSGIWEKWWRAGVRYVNTVPIDNPLADPFDTSLCGAEITVKAIRRQSVEERMGLLCQTEKGIEIVEYSEFPEALFKAKENGSPLFQIANTSLFTFSMAFIEKAASIDLPWHLAKKEFPLSEEKKIPVWKFETFIFDLLPFAREISVAILPRELVYSPLKSSASLTIVQQALLVRDQKRYQSITGIAPSANAIFELDPSFYYPTAEFKAKWHGKALPNESYIS